MIVSHRGADCLGWVLSLPIFVVLFSPPAAAEELNFTLGLKEQWVTLRRTLKLEAQTSSETHRVETPGSDGTLRPAVVLNASYNRWFVGAEVAAVSLNISEQPSSFPNPRFVQSSKVDMTELDLAIGYTVVTGVSPYLGYVRYRQQTDLNCPGCTKTFDLSRIGPGLHLSYPLSNTRWSIYSNLALIQGFSIEGGLGYAGIRWPLVGVAGFAYRRIDYPSKGVSCGQTGGFLCFRQRDVISGPVLAVHYIF